MLDIKVIDLKKRPRFLDQYITLRNTHAEFLLTSPVTYSDTKKWLLNNHIEIRGLIQNDILLGATILYLDREGEIAFFVKQPNTGIGSNLLMIIQEVAHQKGLNSVWAWVLRDNAIARRTFEKNGFLKMEPAERIYKGAIKQGITYRKIV